MNQASNVLLSVWLLPPLKLTMLEKGSVIVDVLESPSHDFRSVSSSSYAFQDLFCCVDHVIFLQPVNSDPHNRACY